MEEPKIVKNTNKKKKKVIKCEFADPFMGFCFRRKCVANCKGCQERIVSFDNHLIHNQFNGEDYQLHVIRPTPIKRLYELYDDFYNDPFRHKLTEFKYFTLRQRQLIKFIVFNHTKNEYCFEIFEMPKKELKDFLWQLEETGYSRSFVKKYQGFVLEED